jgi:hypothetical protein
MSWGYGGGEQNNDVGQAWLKIEQIVNFYHKDGFSLKTDSGSPGQPDAIFSPRFLEEKPPGCYREFENFLLSWKTFGVACRSPYQRGAPLIIVLSRGISRSTYPNPSSQNWLRFRGFRPLNPPNLMLLAKCFVTSPSSRFTPLNPPLQRVETSRLTHCMIFRKNPEARFPPLCKGRADSF